jgi:hypothetical protein
MLEIVKVSNKIIKSKRILNPLEWKTLILLSNTNQINEINEQQEKDLLDDIVIRFNTSYVYELLDTEYHNFNRTLRTLRQHPIIIEDNKKNIEVGIISKRTFYRTGIIEIKIDKDMFPFFKYLKNNYAAINTKVFYKLNYKHSFKLYALLVNVLNQEYKKITCTLKELNYSFGTKYSNFNTLNNNILKQSINEINDKLGLVRQNWKIMYEPDYQDSSTYNIVVFYIQIVE